MPAYDRFCYLTKLPGSRHESTLPFVGLEPWQENAFMRLQGKMHLARTLGSVFLY
jgi:hypothetical protein